MSDKDSFGQFYIQITFDILIEVYFLTGFIYWYTKKQLPISFGTALVCKMIFMGRNSPTYTQISSLL